MLTPRTLLEYSRPDPARVARFEAALRAVPVTRADRTARCSRYDNDPIAAPARDGRRRVLLFEKVVGFRDAASLLAAESAIRKIGLRRNWNVVVTEKGGAMTPATLRRFDVVIWNNVSGDVLTLRQRRAFRGYIEGGGGFVGIHGSGGDPAYFWNWYVDTLLGARFLGHPSAPQFQDAKIVVEDKDNSITQGLGIAWTMNDEWYSFRNSPRSSGSQILATLDETSYKPKEGGRSLAMGDHPIAWTRCVGNGRAFYSAIGHRPESYSEPHHLRLLDQAIDWAAGNGATACRRGQSVPRP